MASRRGGLGRGLDSLIPGGGSQPPTAGSALIEIPVKALSPNPHQPRVHFDEESLNDLSASIREIGVLQPLLVRQLPDGSYQLIAGERRWRAAQRAGLTTVPAVVKTTDDMASMEQALVENLHRQDLSPLEEASAFQQLIDDFNLTHDDVAKRVGKSRSAITNTLRLLNLPQRCRAYSPMVASAPAMLEPCSEVRTGPFRSNSLAGLRPSSGRFERWKRPFGIGPMGEKSPPRAAARAVAGPPVAARSPSCPKPDCWNWRTCWVTTWPRAST